MIRILSSGHGRKRTSITIKKMKEALKELVVRRACELLAQAVPLTEQNRQMPWLVPSESLEALSEAISKLRVAEGEDPEEWNFNNDD